MERGLVAVGYDAWASSDPAQESQRHSFAIFQSPSAGPDEQARQTWEVADSTSKSFVYQSFGMACVDESWSTCGFSAAEARSRGFLAYYNGSEASPSGFPYFVSANMGAPGYGVAWAENVVERMCAVDCRVGGFGYEGPFLDDVNVADNRLPNRGVPDGYASSEAYKEAIKAELVAARDYLSGLGYTTMANFGGITEWEAVFIPADDLIGILEYSMVEHCGIWPDGRAQYEIAWNRIIKAADTASARGKRLLCAGFGGTEALARYNDYLARILGADAALSDGNDYRSPFPWFALFTSEYGTPAGSLVKDGSVLSRRFSGGQTLYVNLETLDAWTESTGQSDGQPGGELPALPPVPPIPPVPPVPPVPDAWTASTGQSDGQIGGEPAALQLVHQPDSDAWTASTGQGDGQTGGELAALPVVQPDPVRARAPRRVRSRVSPSVRRTCASRARASARSKRPRAGLSGKRRGAVCSSLNAKRRLAAPFSP
jgi:hypothetical protein